MSESTDPATTAIIYGGPDEAGVYVPVDGGVLFFPPGEAVDTPEELAKKLLKQQPADWSSTTRATPKKPAQGKE